MDDILYINALFILVRSSIVLEKGGFYELREILSRA